MENKAEIVGGLSIKDVKDGGAVFDVNYTANKDNDNSEEAECIAAMQQYLNLECLDSGKEYDGNEPFLNLTSKMQNLLQNGKIKKRIIREGYGHYPEKSSTVNIHYNAYVQYEAQPFDSTYARKKPFTFQLGDCQVIEGLELAVLSMKINEKSQFLINPELAYRGGSMGRIPPNAEVLFEIELCDLQISINKNEETIDERQFDVAYPICLALCVKGKKMVVKFKDYQGGIKVYLSAVHKLEDAILKDYDDQVKSEELLVRLYTNLLVCYTNAEIPKRGCVFAQKIYDMAKNDTFTVSAKVYFNHAKCLRMLGGYDHAKRRLLQANKLNPNNSDIQQELEALRKAQEKYWTQQKNFGKALMQQ